MDLGEQAYLRWGGVCRALGTQPICACGATIDTYAEQCPRAGKCPGYRRIESEVMEQSKRPPASPRGLEGGGR